MVAAAQAGAAAYRPHRGSSSLKAAPACAVPALRRKRSPGSCAASAALAALTALYRPRGLTSRDPGEPAGVTTSQGRSRRTERLAAYLAGPRGQLGQHAKGLAAVLGSGRFLLILLAAGAIFLCVLATPVLTDRFLGYAAAQGAKVALPTFGIGLVILLVGLAIGVEVVDFVGAGLMGIVILGVILDNYLSASAPAAGTSICGSNVLLRSPGTARSTAPTSVSSVLPVVPLRLFPLPRPGSLCHRVSFREPPFLRLIVRPRHLHSR